MWTLFDNLKYLYSVNAYTNEDIAKCVEYGAITKEQYEEITGDKYPE
ncbi:XkdX family protein [Mammaliicoccus sciuri]|nr:XkdX family protein [Mammaliicoccus sciuri]PTJ53942.1 XkdX family protein [Mammaliicoccus sciuri]